MLPAALTVAVFVRILPVLVPSTSPRLLMRVVLPIGLSIRPLSTTDGVPGVPRLLMVMAVGAYSWAMSKR